MILNDLNSDNINANNLNGAANGILLIDKPKGWTSFDCVAKVRGILRSATGIKKIKVGHSGTLDPIATGVLPIFIGKATKTISLIENKNKEYIADFKLGMTTDTLDSTGEILTEIPLPSDLLAEDLTERINALLPKFTGKISQTPPMYSAVKVDGVRLYKIARKGAVVERKMRDIEIYNIELLESVPFNRFKLKISCSAGTYVRVLIDDIGKEMRFGAVMTDLVRTKSNGFDIENCTSIENLNRENIFDFISDSKIVN
ncbi:MAG: tRNA pseudouridine(55) synthase TruB [Ruminococcus sp.]|jgi:tRNA pseudouridine55 synthase|nr:tRNA pseudouridine(55) synthase TruB [Ruminococcus sp.]